VVLWHSVTTMVDSAIMGIRSGAKGGTCPSLWKIKNESYVV